MNNFKQQISVLTLMTLVLGIINPLALAASDANTGSGTTEKPGIFKKIKNIFSDDPSVISRNFDKVAKKAEKQQKKSERLKLKTESEKFKKLSPEKQAKLKQDLSKLQKKADSKKVKNLKKELEKQKEDFRKMSNKLSKSDQKKSEDEEKKDRDDFKKQLKNRYNKLKELNDQQKADFEAELNQVFASEEKELVDALEPNYLLELQDFIPNDELYSQQWSLGFIGVDGFAQAPDSKKAKSEKQDKEKEGKNKKDKKKSQKEPKDDKKSEKQVPATEEFSNKPIIAVIDTGFDLDHPELQNAWWGRSECYDYNGNLIEGGCPVGYDVVGEDTNPEDETFSHGTAVAGVIGAATNNEEGIASLSNNLVEIMPIRACSNDGYFRVEDVVEGIYFAVNNGADVINMSLGGGTYSTTLYDAVNYAQDNGVVVVAAAGNYGQNNDVNPLYPASYDLDNIISAGAYDDKGYLASFSNYGATTVDILAPGVNVLTTTTGGGTRAYSGTSFSAPMVASSLVRFLVEGNKKDVSEKLFQDVNGYESLKFFIDGGKRLEFGEMKEEIKPPSAGDDIVNSEEPIEFIDEYFFGQNSQKYSFRKRTRIDEIMQKFPDSSYTKYDMASSAGSPCLQSYDLSCIDSSISDSILLTLLELKWQVFSSDEITKEELLSEMHTFMDSTFLDEEERRKAYYMGREGDALLHGSTFDFIRPVRYYFVEYANYNHTGPQTLSYVKNEIILPNGETFSVPSGTNPGSYAVLKYLAKMAETQEEWVILVGDGPGSFKDTFLKITEQLSFQPNSVEVQQEASPPFPSPFIQRKPFSDYQYSSQAITDLKKKYIPFNSFLDHDSTYNNNKVNRFDGKVFNNREIQGESFYDGHLDGVDWGTGGYNYELYPSHAGEVFLVDDFPVTICPILGGVSTNNTRFEIKISERTLGDNRKEIYVARYFHLNHYQENGENYWIPRYNFISTGVTTFQLVPNLDYDLPENSDKRSVDITGTIGTVGNNGCSSGAHLHYGIVRYVFEELENGTLNKTVEDPIEYLDPFGSWSSDGSRLKPSFFKSPEAEDGIITIDDKDISYQNFNTIGNEWAWKEGGTINQQAINNQAWYAYREPSTNTTSWSSWATWNATLPETRRYEVQVFVPPYRAPNSTENSSEVQYSVYHKRGRTDRVINQEAGRDPNGLVGKWASLGAFEFTEGANAMVRIIDQGTTATSDPDNARKAVWADAIRFVPNDFFLDVPEGEWFTKYVKYLYTNGVVSGYADGEFKAANEVSRAEVLKMAYAGKGIDVSNVNGDSGLVDVPTWEWFYPYVKHAKDAGYISGRICADGNGLCFFPHETVDRYEVAKIMHAVFKNKDYRTFNGQCVSPFTKDFTDVNQTDNYCSAVQWLKNTPIYWIKLEKPYLVKSNIANGYDSGCFAKEDCSKTTPNKINRAEISKVIANAMRDSFGAAIMPNSLETQSFTVQSVQEEDLVTLGHLYEQIISNDTNQAPEVPDKNYTITEGTSQYISFPTTDQDGDQPFYFWSATGGSFSTTDTNKYTSATWTAPQVEADTTYYIEVTAGDGQGKIDTGLVTITVQNEVSQPSNEYDYQTTHNGNWKDPSNWSGGLVPSDNISKTVKVDHLMDISADNESIGVDELYISNNGQIRMNVAGQGTMIAANKIYNYGNIEKYAGGLTIRFFEEFQNFGNIIDHDSMNTLSLLNSEEANLESQINIQSENEDLLNPQLATTSNLEINASGYLYNAGLWSPTATYILQPTRISHDTELSGDIIEENNDYLTINAGTTVTVNNLSNETRIDGEGTLIVKGEALGSYLKTKNLIFEHSGTKTVYGAFNDNGNVTFRGGTTILNESESEWQKMLVESGMVQLTNPTFNVYHNLEVINGAKLQNVTGIDVTVNAVESMGGNFTNLVKDNTVVDNPAGGSINFEGDPNATEPCTPPTSGTWIITESCTLPHTVTAPANVLVSPNAVLTIPANMVLYIDLVNYNLTVEVDGGVLIMPEGALKQTGS